MKRLLVLCIGVFMMFSLMGCATAAMLFQSYKGTIHYESNGGPEVKDTKFRIWGIQMIFNHGSGMGGDEEKCFYKVRNDPVWEGYVFLGWYWDNETFINPHSGDCYLGIEPIDEDERNYSGTLYARWVTEALYNTAFDVTFELLDGEIYLVESILYSRYVDQPENPELEDLTFSTWFEDEARAIIYEFDQEIRDHLTLYAEFGTAGLEYEWDVHEVNYYVSTGTTFLVEHVVVPHFYEGRRVIGLKREAFTEPNSVTKTIHLPGTFIEGIDGQFQGNPSLEAITVAETNLYLRSIDGLLFNKSGTRLVMYPANRPDETFVTPIGVTRIQAYAFSTTQNLKHVTIRKEVSEIDLFAFHSSPSIEVVDFESNSELTEMKWHAFARMPNLKYLFIPESVQNIEGYSFDGLDHVILLAESAIKPDGWLENWNINKGKLIPVIYNVSQIASNNMFEYVVFKDDTVGLLRILDAEASTVMHLDHIDEKPITLLAKGLFRDNQTIEEVTLPVGIRVIPEYTFNNAQNLKAVHFHEDAHVEIIESFSFANTPRLETFTILDSVKKIAQNAFTASGVKVYYIPESVIEIGPYAFGLDYPNTGFIYAEAASRPIGWYEFIADGQFEIIYDYQEHYSDDMFHYILQKSATAVLIGFSHDQAVQDLVIPEFVNGHAVTHVLANAFSQNQSLRSVVIPDSVSKIGDRAFWDCYELETITISRNADLKHIGDSAFRGLPKLRTFNFPSTLEYIDRFAFDGTYLIQVVLPESMYYVGNFAFREFYFTHVIVLKDEVDTLDWGDYWCSGCDILYGAVKVVDDGHLKYVIVNDDEAYLYGVSSFNESDEIVVLDTVLGRSVTRILRGSFYYEPITSIAISHTVERFDSFAFYHLRELTSFDIPIDSQLKIMCMNAFIETSHIETFYIPISVETIEKHVFIGYIDTVFHIAASEKPPGWHEEWHATTAPMIWGYQA